MKTTFLLVAILFITLAHSLVGCGGKGNAKSELEKAASALEKAPPPVPAPEQSAPVVASTPAANTAGQPAAAVEPPSKQMSAAIASYKAGNLEDAVTRLQKLRSTPVMSPDQRIALNDAIAAVMTEVYSLAAKGDSRAIAAVKQYEQMQTQRR